MQEGQSQAEGKQLIQPAGKRKGKNTRKEKPYSTAVYQWKKKIQALSTGGLGVEVADAKQTHATASGGMGTEMSSPAKSFGHHSCCLSSCKLLANPIPGKGWGQILVQER